MNSQQLTVSPRVWTPLWPSRLTLLRDSYAGRDCDRCHRGELYWVQSGTRGHLQCQLGTKWWRQDSGGPWSSGAESFWIWHSEGIWSNWELWNTFGIPNRSCYVQQKGSVIGKNQYGQHNSFLRIKLLMTKCHDFQFISKDWQRTALIYSQTAFVKIRQKLFTWNLLHPTPLNNSLNANIYILVCNPIWQHYSVCTVSY